MPWTSRSIVNSSTPTTPYGPGRPVEPPDLRFRRSGPPPSSEFLDLTKTKRLYPALHLVAHTGIRRGEVAGLNWADFDDTAMSLSIVRTRQVTADGTVEAPVKTRTSRRRIDLDANTVRTLCRWQRRLVREGATIDLTTPMFINRHHRAPSPESFSQLFTRSVAATELPRIRFHDLRHTHASLLVAAGVPIKVVSERLGHAHPRFHDAHLPAPAPRHGRRSRQPVRPTHQRQPVDIYRLGTR